MCFDLTYNYMNIYVCIHMHLLEIRQFVYFKLIKVTSTLKCNIVPNHSTTLLECLPFLNKCKFI